MQIFPTARARKDRPLAGNSEKGKEDGTASVSVSQAPWHVARRASCLLCFFEVEVEVAWASIMWPGRRAGFLKKKNGKEKVVISRGQQGQPAEPRHAKVSSATACAASSLMGTL